MDDDDFINDESSDEEWDEIRTSPPKKSFAAGSTSTASPSDSKAANSNHDSKPVKSVPDLKASAKPSADPKASKPFQEVKAAKPSPDASILEKDNSFREFRKLCADIANESTHSGKTALVTKYIEKGTTGSGYPRRCAS